MAHFRATMLAAHVRALESGKLSAKDADYQRELIRTIQEVQRKNGEVA